MTAVAALVGAFSIAPLFNASAADQPAPTASPAGTASTLLPAKKLILKSAKQVDLHDGTVCLPLHRGQANGKTVWYILTESSDVGLAADLGVNYAAKLTNLGITCAACGSPWQWQPVLPQRVRRSTRPPGSGRPRAAISAVILALRRSIAADPTRRMVLLVIPHLQA